MNSYQMLINTIVPFALAGQAWAWDSKDSSTIQAPYQCPDLNTLKYV